MTSSPGLPYSREAPTNGQWLKWNGVECDDIQLNRLWHDVQLVLRDEWDTELRVFVKQEPHKKAKAKEGRWRLIMCSPLCVQVAWKMLFSILNDIEINQSYFIPSQQGIVLVGGGWRQYFDSWKKEGVTMGLDKSAWDWTAPFWCIMLDFELRKRLCRGGRIADWEKIGRILYRHMFEDPTLVLSDGSRFKQIVPGVMKSGCESTISINSHCQVFMHLVVCYDCGIGVHPLPKCCGDDTLQHPKHVNSIDAYTRYGVVIKSASEETEFVGHEFTERGPHPLYMGKHIKNVQYVPDDVFPDYLESMARMYVHTRYYDLWEYLANMNGTPLAMSKEYYLYWYDYSD